MANSLSLHIPPVYSAYHPTERIGTTRLLKHQVETEEAFNNPDIDVVINTAMTGDGKSLAAYLPAFRNDKSVVAMYPTNELIRDQHNALPSYEQRLSISLPHNDTMFSAKISELMRLQDISQRLEAVRNLLRWNNILLTNPDIVHLIMSLQYGWDHRRKELPQELSASYDYLLFDEFHVFDVPQVIAVTNMLGYFLASYERKQEQRRKFVFLSATPSKLFDTLLERGGVRYKRISGTYTSAEQDGYRRILQPCDLELHEITQEQRTEQWIGTRLNEIRDFFKQYPHSKGAILVNSVATARRLVKLLKEQLEQPYGITIGENTGLTDPVQRKASFEKMLLVGTSTVDIGVDFRINLLIFEAFNAGSFIQRFGRLGRHEGYATYRAYALVPRFVLERFGARYANDVELERATFNASVHEVFPVETEFKQYAKRWGVVQAAQVLEELRHLQDENTLFTEALERRYEQFYGNEASAGTVMKKAGKRYWGIKRNCPEIIKELTSFRGQSPLSCGVWDVDGHVQTYNLFFLLTNTTFRVIEREEFMQQVRAKGGDEKEFERQLLYFRIEEYVPERKSLLLYTPKDMLAQSEDFHKVLVESGITVREPKATWLHEVNRRLGKCKLVCIISDRQPDELKQSLHLGALFQVVRLEDKFGSSYSIIFGQEALLAHTELSFRKTKSDSPIFG